MTMLQANRRGSRRYSWRFFLWTLGVLAIASVFWGHQGNWLSRRILTVSAVSAQSETGAPPIGFPFPSERPLPRLLTPEEAKEGMPGRVQHMKDVRAALVDAESRFSGDPLPEHVQAIAGSLERLNGSESSRQLTRLPRPGELSADLPLD